MKFAVIVILFTTFTWIESNSINSCKSLKHNESETPDVYWINLDRSQERKRFMLNQLSFYKMSHHRVKAITPKQVLLPIELIKPFECNTAGNASDILDHSLYIERTRVSKLQIFIKNHCGRPKNTIRELSVTLSHLYAIRRAINDNNSKSPYALILEDDLQFLYQVDFHKLIASAPTDFGILQLITSNSFSVQNLWNVYKETEKYWVKRKDRDDYWCAGAYIINKPLLKPYIDAILSPFPYDVFVQNPKSWLNANIIAGYEKPICYPKLCCNGTKLILTDENKRFCIFAKRGYQADHFIYSLLFDKTYMLTIPMLTGAKYGSLSTLHQDHVNFHVTAFQKIQNLSIELLQNNEKFPPFYNKFCRFNKAKLEEFINFPIKLETEASH